MPDEDEKRAAHRALVDRVLNGEGRASAEERARGLRARRPLPEADLAAATSSGCTEDQLFELVKPGRLERGYR